MFPSHHWGEWNDSQLQPTIQKLMKGYNRYLRPNFNGRVIVSPKTLTGWASRSVDVSCNGCWSSSKAACGSLWQRVLWKLEWVLILPASMLSPKSIWYSIASYSICQWVSRWLMEDRLKDSASLFPGLHCDHLPPSTLAWFPAGVPRKWECQCGWTPRVTAVDPWHLHPRLQALLPAWRHGGKPPHPHLQQWNCSLRTSVHFLSLFIWHFTDIGRSYNGTCRISFKADSQLVRKLSKMEKQGEWKKKRKWRDRWGRTFPHVVFMITVVINHELASGQSKNKPQTVCIISQSHHLGECHRRSGLSGSLLPFKQFTLC